MQANESQIHWWSSLRHKDVSHWQDAFTVCSWIDELENAKPAKVREEMEDNLEALKSWQGFIEWRDILIDDFEEASIVQDPN